MKTAKEALATHLGYNMADLTDYNYQPGRFTRTVYAVDGAYYSAVKDASKLPKPTRRETNPFNWVQVEDSYTAKYGWLIFKATETK